MLQIKNIKGEDASIIFSTKAGLQIAKLIFNYPHKSFHIRELARLTSFSTTAITKAIENLEKYKLIKVEMNVAKEIKANIDSESYANYKLIFNIYRIMRYGLINTIKVFLNNPECIVLFGSFAKGEDIEESDIDLLIITNNKINSDLNPFITVWEKEFNRKINLHILKLK